MTLRPTPTHTLNACLNTLESIVSGCLGFFLNTFLYFLDLALSKGKLMLENEQGKQHATE
jgi:hypothetical protein